MVAPNRRIRVVHLVSTLNVGGLEMVVWNLARLADTRRFDVRVLCLGQPGDLAPRFADIGTAVDALDADGCSKSSTVYRLIRRLRQLKPDILHTHNPAPHLFGTIAAHLSRIPVLINTKHGRNRTDLPRQIVMNRVLAHWSSCVVPVSEDAAEVARQIERVPASKLKVIRNGIDLQLFEPPAEEHPFRKQAIHVARLNLVKDQVTLLKAVRIVADADPEFRLDIVGDGPSKDELIKCHRDLGLKDSVRFLGHQDRVRALLAEADFFVLSSLTEGISLTLLEAMAMRLPVVATDVGGNREVVSKDETGLLVPAESPQALALAILDVIRNPQQARAMGRAGRRRVEEHFDVRNTVDQYESLYKRLLSTSEHSWSPGRAFDEGIAS